MYWIYNLNKCLKARLHVQNRQECLAWNEWLVQAKSLCLICSLKYYLYGYNLHSPTSWTLKLHRKRRYVFDGITSQALLNLCSRESGSAQSVTSNTTFVTKNINPLTESSYKSESGQIKFHHLNPVPKNNQFRLLFLLNSEVF